MDADKAYREKARRELHKNATSYIEQILEATSKQIYRHLPPISKTIQLRWKRHVGHYWRSKEEFISDVFQWTPSLGRASVDRPTRTSLKQLCADTKTCWKRWMIGINDKLESGKSVQAWAKWCKRIIKLDTTWWERSSTRNCARNRNLTLTV